MRLVLASAAPALATLAVQQFGFGGLASAGPAQLTQCVLLTVLYLGGVAGMIFLLKIEEFWSLLGNRAKGPAL